MEKISVEMMIVRKNRSKWYKCIEEKKAKHIMKKLNKIKKKIVNINYYFLNFQIDIYILAYKMWFG